MRIGIAAGELAIGGAVEGLRRLGESTPADAGSVFLTGPAARRLAERLSRLRGAAMKLGQLFSLEGNDLIPTEFAEALAILRASATPMPLAQLRRVLGREWGAGWEARLAEFDFEPIAAASIGQVHRARTADGRDLALKIQYPGVARSIDSDVDNVAALLRLARLLPAQIDFRGIVAEAKRQLHQEADYLAEARFLSRFRKLVADEPRLVVPRVHTDFTTKRILAMDYVEGEPLEALAGGDVDQSERDAVGASLEHLLFRELFEFHVMQTDPNFANFLWDRNGQRMVLLDFGSTREFPADFVGKYRRICRAILKNDRTAVRRHALEIGYLTPEASPAQAEAVIDVIMLVCEPLRHRGTYDFPHSDLPSRARALGIDLAFRKGLLRPPPPETIFLHRKLVGAFFILARIGARVNAHALVKPFLEES
jgi:predicted unusual protein kinase regulating ubiquinone biosynthesis (AarF/ABC1/UbiB family)